MGQTTDRSSIQAAAKRLLALCGLMLLAACGDFPAMQEFAARSAHPALHNDVVIEGETGMTTALIGPAVPVSRMQCVPFARQVSGVSLRGNAPQWWRDAASQFERGHDPREMAVMVLKPSGNMNKGHVAVVTKVIDDRNLLVSQANWGWDRYTRGIIRHGQKVTDVSPGNDWSSVRFYNKEFHSFGRPYPAYGFIYGDSAEARSQPVSQVLAHSIAPSNEGVREQVAMLKAPAKPALPDHPPEVPVLTDISLQDDSLPEAATPEIVKKTGHGVTVAMVSSDADVVLPPMPPLPPCRPDRVTALAKQPRHKPR